MRTRRPKQDGAVLIERRPRNRKPKATRERVQARRLLGGGLCLSRWPGEDVRLDLPHGGQIFLTVIECRGGRTKFHIEAPRDVLISRGELVDQSTGNVPPAAHAAVG